MAALNWILSFAETLLLVATGICCLIVATCVGLSKNGFDGNCPLFSEVKWCNITSVEFTYLGKAGSCHFIILSEVIVGFFVLLYAVYHVCYLVEKMKEYHRFMLPGIIADALALISIFVSACLLSIGFKRFCNSLNSNSFDSSRTCSDVPNWNTKPKPAMCGVDKFPAHGDIKSENYFQLFSTAQGAGWFGFLFLLLATASLVIRRIMYRPAVGDPSTSDKAPVIPNMVM